MKFRRFNHHIIVILGILLFAFTPTEGLSQGCDSAQAKKTFTLYLSNRNLEDALSIISAKAGISVGFVDLSTVRVPSQRISTKLVCTTVENALSKILAQDDRYKWEIDGDFVYISPSDANSILNQIANLKIQRLEFENVRLSDFGLALLNSDLVKEQLDLFQKSAIGGLKYSGPARENPNVTISIDNDTVRGVLNRLVSEGFANGWKLALDGADDRFVQITILGAVSK